MVGLLVGHLILGNWGSAETMRQGYGDRHLAVILLDKRVKRDPLGRLALDD